MSTTALAAFLVLSLVFVAVIGMRLGGKLDRLGLATVRKRKFLTEREQAMFNRLATTLPTMRIMSQVSFGALLTTTDRATRNRFDRKIADFVLCDASMTPQWVVELDDRSHDRKTAADAARDEMLRAAGYRVLRYGNVPDAEQILEDIRTNKEPK